MSRCFPYEGKRSSNDALILSIKLQREQLEANSNREREPKSSDRKKDRKREKKGKKKEEQSIGSALATHKQKADNLYQSDKLRTSDLKGKSVLLEDESEVRENSSVTEEHGQPIDLQNGFSSADSTVNSSKRKREPLPQSVSRAPGGNIFRIRLPSKRVETSISGREGHEIKLPEQTKQVLAFPHVVQPTSNVVTTESAIKRNDVIPKVPRDATHSASTSYGAQNVSRPIKEEQCLPDKGIDLISVKESISSSEKKMRRKVRQYEELFGNWIAPPVEYSLEINDNDDDWLFGSKGEEKPAKRLNSGNTEDRVGSFTTIQSCASSAVLQPRAQFLPDADIYALPFTVPF